MTGNLGSIAFGSRFKTISENGSGAFIPVTLSNVATLPANGSFRISLLSTWSNGSTADLSGWQTQRIQVTNSPTAIQIPLTINNDASVEDDEYLVFKIDSLEGLTLTGADYFTYFITDDDRQAPVSSGAVVMTPLASFDPTPGLAATTEVVAYDPISKRAYLSSGVQRRFDMVSLANPSSPVTLGSVSMQPYGGITGLAVKPGLLAVASPDSIEQNPGRVIFFDTLGNYKGQVTVGALPDMITFTHDGKYLLTANEGQPNTTFSVDPEGSVSIIDVQDTNYVQSDVTTLNFTGFNAISASLMASGVRKGSTFGTLSQNLEPEYITVSSDNTKAWVTLQENNSIAHLDLVNKIVTNITPMGMKNHQTAQNGFDASDNNGVVLMTNWPVKSFYMPDALAQFTVGTTTYLVTANEGDEREYTALNERTTVGAVNLDPTRFPNGAMLKETHALGRLRITNQSGDLDADGDYDELHMVGPRSFAIYNAATGAQVYESKNLIESIVLADPTWGPFFNADSESNTRKNRSRSKGPEPEGVAVGKIGSRTFAFIALERVGGVMAFEVTNPAAPVFSGYLNTRSTSSLAG
ncbi:MAG: alkaline phosphatase, partial [Cytophagia bacterium]|nr:alkaline phosphatase [Cytophagia bacterium]